MNFVHHDTGESLPWPQHGELDSVVDDLNNRGDGRGRLPIIMSVVNCLLVKLSSLGSPPDDIPGYFWPVFLALDQCRRLREGLGYKGCSGYRGIITFANQSYFAERTNSVRTVEYGLYAPWVVVFWDR